VEGCPSELLRVRPPLDRPRDDAHAGEEEQEQTHHRQEGGGQDRPEHGEPVAAVGGDGDPEAGGVDGMGEVDVGLPLGGRGHRRHPEVEGPVGHAVDEALHVGFAVLELPAAPLRSAISSQSSMLIPFQEPSGPAMANGSAALVPITSVRSDSWARAEAARFAARRGTTSRESAKERGRRDTRMPPGVDGRGRLYDSVPPCRKPFPGNVLGASASDVSGL
jgi:hypothetical protein